MPPPRDPPRARALELMQLDPLPHIVGLKMLSHVAAAKVALEEDASGWAASITFPSSAFEYDAQNYGPDTQITVLEGSSEALQLGLLDALEVRDSVLKTQSPAVVRAARERFGARPVAAFLSFTAGQHGSSRAAPPPDAANAVSTSTTLTPALAAIFERNGYTAAELARHFAAGARWFSIEARGASAAACFVFRNFGRVWEIAGVHTEPSQRRRGLGARVVEVALEHLLAAGALPRYQTSAANAASVALARRVGLVEFLRIEHLCMGRSGRPRHDESSRHSGP